MKNRLYYGDNLEILRNREYFLDECVDLFHIGKMEMALGSAVDYFITIQSSTLPRRRHVTRRRRLMGLSG